MQAATLLQQLSEKSKALDPIGLTGPGPNEKDDFTPLDPDRRRKGLRWNKIASIAFGTVQGLYLAVSIFAVYMMISGWEKVSDFDNNGQPNKRADIPAYHGEIKMPPLTPKARGMYFFSTAVCVAMNIILLFTMRWTAGVFVWFGPGLLMIGLAAGAILAAKKGAILIAVVWFCFIPLVGLFCIGFKGRMQLGKYLLSLAGKISAKSTTMFGLVFVGLFVQFLLSVINILAMVGWFLVFQPEHEIIGCLFLLSAHTWLSAFVSNVVLMSIAGGSFSSYYFGTEKRSSFTALKHTLQKAKGTVAFGTLCVGVIQFLDGVLGVFARSQATGILGIIMHIIAACLKVFTAPLAKALEWFNKYAYIFCAIGKRDKHGQLAVRPFEETYFEAGLHCIDFVKRRPKRRPGQDQSAFKGVMHQFTRNHAFSTVINDDITGVALFMACLSTAVMCSLSTWIYRWSMTGEFDFDEWYDWMAVIYPFILGLTIGLITTSALEIGVSTLFVCISEDIEQLHKVDPEFEIFLRSRYEGMFHREGYPPYLGASKSADQVLYGKGAERELQTYKDMI